MNYCNRRTLKRRIRRAMFICVLVSLFLFTSLVLFLGAQVFKSWATLVSGYFSYSISEELNSPYLLKQLNIKGLEDFNPNSPEAMEWLKNFRQTNIMSVGKFMPEPPAEVEPPEGTGSHVKIQMGKGMAEGAGGLFNPQDLILVDITLNNRALYSSALEDGGGFLTDIKTIKEAGTKNILIRKLLSFYNVESQNPLKSSTGQTIGTVTVRMNDAFLIVTFITVASGVIFAAFLALLIAMFIGRILAIPVNTPIQKLDQQFRAVSAGDYESTVNAHITLKKPLCEIESLAQSTNLIMDKMREYNELLTAQNEELEAQNEELETQKIQLQDAQTQLIQNENLASIGQLTAAITHEINTPLGAISSNIQMSEILIGALEAKASTIDDPDLKELAAQLKEANGVSRLAGRRVTDIIRSLKNFSKLDQAEFQEANLEDGLKSVLILTSNLWKKNITIHENYGSLPVVKCFPGMLNQVFMNLVVNAIQSIDGKGDIYISTAVDEKYAYVHIKDNGTGIRPEDLSRIFDSGFSTKKTGMGLGLSICQNIIKKHNGEIQVTSNPGEGTEFTVCIPLTTDKS